MQSVKVIKTAIVGFQISCCQHVSPRSSVSAASQPGDAHAAGALAPKSVLEKTPPQPLQSRGGHTKLCMTPPSNTSLF
jgi:hypothetical protein